MRKSELSSECDVWYRVLFEANPLPMLVYDRKSFSVLDVNQSAVQHYGYSRGEWLNMSIRNLLAAKDVKAALTELKQEPEEAFHHAGIWRHFRKDQSLIDVDMLRYLIPYEGKSAALVMIHDVTEQRRLEGILRQAEDDLNEAQKTARLGSWVLDLVKMEDRWSEQEYLNFGLEPYSIASGYDVFLNRIVHPDDRKMVEDRMRQSVFEHEPYDYDHRIIWPDGSVHVVHEQGRVLYDENGRPVKIFGTTLDVTEQRLMENKLRQAQKDLQKAQEIAHIGTWVWDARKDAYDSWSEETYRILGFKPNELPANSKVLQQRIHPDDRDAVERARQQGLVDPKTPYDMEFRVVHPDGAIHVLHSMAEVVFDTQGTALRMVGITQDITQRRAAEEKIKRLAYYDEPTGLTNRVLLRQELDKALATCGGVNRPVALLVIDLVRFGEINYTLGHANSDWLLKEVGARISQALDAGVLVARIGDAQFAVLLSDADAYDATLKIRRILKALEAPFDIAGIAYELGAHIGFALAPGHGMDTSTIMRKAEVALYQAKQSGQAYAVYQASEDPYKPQRLALIGEFRKAIQSGELQLYCQPKANLQTGQIIGAEALVRWHHPKYGLLAPDQFIPLIEPTDLIHPLTKFMLEAAVSQCYSWQQHGIHIPLAVNVSPRNLTEPDLIKDLGYLLLTWGADPQWLGMEITESSLMKDPVRSIAELERLSKMGICLFVDDFGTGYSSLSYLMKLPINVIKIDHSFAMRMMTDKGAAAIVKSTIELAHNLGMKVVAEGTASREIWDALSGYGCDEAQGYFISPPMPAGEFMPWLQASSFDFPKEPGR